VRDTSISESKESESDAENDEVWYKFIKNLIEEKALPDNLQSL
jgi:hypothetical protein